MKENIIYIKKFKSEIGDIKVIGKIDGQEHAILGETKSKDKLIEATRRTMAMVKKYGKELYDEKDPYLGYPKIPGTKFPICL